MPALEVRIELASHRVGHPRGSRAPGVRARRRGPRGRGRAPPQGRRNGRPPFAWWRAPERRPGCRRSRTRRRRALRRGSSRHEPAARRDASSTSPVRNFRNSFIADLLLSRARSFLPALVRRWLVRPLRCRSERRRDVRVREVEHVLDGSTAAALHRRQLADRPPELRVAVQSLGSGSLGEPLDRDRPAALATPVIERLPRRDGEHPPRRFRSSRSFGYARNAEMNVSWKQSSAAEGPTAASRNR